ncbi:tn3 transposase DDE domain, putative [Babesia ovis]|uniref:Tn3 transposase DDE domain, putative n=1 Tax=Babesia ovis TaxID=5869 RepID=A0A9W5WW63_BABOV|nr:tn3 transposase DDE domain, putative [Babesia ovis]
MQMIWLLPLATVGLSQIPQVLMQPNLAPAPPANAVQQQPNAGQNMQPGNGNNVAGQPNAPQGMAPNNLPNLPDIPEQHIATEPREPETLTVATLEKKNNLVTSPASEDNSRNYLLKASFFKLTAFESHMELKAKLIQHLRSKIGDGFLLNFDKKFMEMFNTVLASKTTYNATKATVPAPPGNPTQQIATNVYRDHDAYITDITGRSTKYDTWIKYVLNLGYAWGPDSNNEMLRIVLHYTFKRYGDDLFNLYELLKSASVNLADPNTTNADRDKIHDALQDAIKYTKFTSNPFYNPQQIASAFLKYSDLKEKRSDAFKLTAGILGQINAFLVGTPSPERALALALTDVSDVAGLADYVSLLPNRSVGVALTAEDWVKDAYTVSYISSVSLLRAAEVCRSLIDHVARDKTDYDVKPFVNSYHHLVKGVNDYSDKLANLMFDNYMENAVTLADGERNKMNEMATRFFIEYKSALMDIYSSMDAEKKKAIMTSTGQIDVSLLNIGVKQIWRMLRFYAIRMTPKDDNKADAEFLKTSNTLNEYATATTFLERSSRHANEPFHYTQLISMVLTAKDLAKTGFTSLKDAEKIARTWYPAPLAKPELHSMILDDMAISMMAVEHEVHSSVDGSSGMVSPGGQPLDENSSSFLALHSALILGLSLLLTV